MEIEMNICMHDLSIWKTDERGLKITHISSLRFAEWYSFLTFKSTLWRIPLTKCVSVFQIKDLLRNVSINNFWSKPNFISHLQHQISWLTISWFFWCEKGLCGVLNQKLARIIWCIFAILTKVGLLFSRLCKRKKINAEYTFWM